MSGFLTFENVSKSFGSTRAVDGVKLSVGKGEVFSLLGPSGCGKTTLLRLAAGFESPDAGRIILNGRDITALPPEKRPVNTVFQNYALFPHLSVAENIAFGLRMARRERGHIEREVARMLDLVQLRDHAAKLPSQLSGGQKQRVAIARALVNRPEVLLLDEPLAALDLKLRQHMLAELHKLHEEVGITFIYVTHDQTEAMGLSDRIAIMNAGRIEQLGAPRELYENPAGRFVAGFVGDANFLHGNVITSRAGALHEIEVAGLGVIRAVCQPPLPEGAGVELVIRPERIRVGQAPLPESADTNVFPAVVADAIYLGATTRWILRAGATRILAEQPGSFRKEEALFLSFSPDDVRVLPAEGGAVQP